MTKCWFGILFLLLLAGCAPGANPAAPQPGEPSAITVMAAASLSAAFTEIGAAFEAQHAGLTVTFNFAGSQQLAQQILQGAPADVFASAAAQQMDDVVAGGQAAGTPLPFAANKLVMIVPSANPGGITSLTDLARPGLKLVLAAPEVPAGQYAAQFLVLAGADPAFPSGYAEAVRANVVSYEENVKAVLTKVTLGEADAGIVYSTDAAAVTGSVTQIEIPPALNVLASYPITTLKASVKPQLAQAFVEFVLSAQGQSILSKHGFLPPVQ